MKTKNRKKFMSGNDILASIIVAIGFICFFMNPNMSDINFLAHSLTIFSISLAMIAFVSPILQRSRNNLILSESNIIVSYRERIKRVSDYISDMDKQIEDIDLKLQDKKILKRRKKNLLDEKNDILRRKTNLETLKIDIEESSTSFLISIITKLFRAYKGWIRICLIMIVLLIVVNHILFTSPVFSSFIHKMFPSISNLTEWKICISNFINLSTLAAQLFFLYSVCMSTMNILVRLIKKES